MPQHPTRILPDGWQAVRRADGWWLQRRRPAFAFDNTMPAVRQPSAWEDYSGPYRRRSSAVERYVRLQSGNLFAPMPAEDHQPHTRQHMGRACPDPYDEPDYDDC